jgi:hypothetical protein
MQVLLPTLVAAPAFFLGALLFHVLASAFGAEPRFSQTLGLFSLAHLASAAGALAKGALVRASDTIEVTLGPGALVPGVPFESGLGIFLDLFDVFSILNAVLLAIGARVVYHVEVELRDRGDLLDPESGRRVSPANDPGLVHGRVMGGVGTRNSRALGAVRFS